MYFRRIKIFLALVFFVLTILVARVGYLQIVRGDDYLRQAEQALRREQLTGAQRGRILDRHGRILAIDQPCFDLCMEYGMIADEIRWRRRAMIPVARSLGVSVREEGWRNEIVEPFGRRVAGTWSLVHQLAAEVGQDVAERRREIVDRFETWARAAGGRVAEQNQAHPLVTGLDAAQAARVKEAMDSLIGVTVRPSTRRWYPYQDLACHIVGVTGPVTREDLADNLPADHPDLMERLAVNYLPWDAIGRSGIEKLAEDILRGRRGYRQTRLGGGVLREIEPAAGDDVRLTLDVRLQQGVQRIFRTVGPGPETGRKTGAAVMIHVPTGQILAMVSEPGYDLNRYYDDYRLLTAEPTNLVYLPLLHRAVALRHPPGSTVKPITALAGLATGTITPDTVLPCAPGYMGKSPTNFRCWIYKRYHRPHDDLDLVEAIMRSCNVYFFRVGDQVGHDALCQWFSLLGYDRPCGTGLPEEKSGRVPDSRWYRRVADRGVYPSDTWNMSIGQGEIGPTPLHVANAMATIARDGVLLSPRISLNAGPEQVRQTLPIPGEYIAAVREGMKRVVNQRDGGTAYRHFHGAGVGLDVTLCGKTGTAETAPQRVDSNENGRIDGQDMIVRQGDTAWFAGFAPHENPQVAFAVVVEYCQGGGGTNAGPIAREMVRLADELHYLQPAPE